MNKTMKIILAVVVVMVIAIPLVINIGVRQMGRHFVHDQPSTPEYYQHIQNRVSFSVQSRGEVFDSVLNNWLKQHPPYGHYDSIGTTRFRYDTCRCDCLPLKRWIYFPASPKEIYLITYDYGDIRSGIIDIVYQYRDSTWSCQKSSSFDSTEKARIENRLENEIVKKLNL